MKSSAGKREKQSLVAGADARLERSDRAAFFTSTPFLLFMLIVIGVAVSYAFFMLAFTETQKANEVPKGWRKQAEKIVKPLIGAGA